MQIHLMIEPHNGATYDDQLAVARLAESLGFAGLFRADHYLSGVPDGARGGITDTWTTLAGLARETSRITLGSLVTSATFRLPSSLAVIVAQVDAMSGGRVELGLGAGWWPAEHSAMGIPFAATAERFDRFAEQLEVITGLWSTAPDERFDYAGAHYTLTDAPGIRTHRDGGVPLIVGGSGPRRTPELAARFAAEFNSGWLAPDETATEFARVTEACRRIGRDPATLRLSTVQVLDDALAGIDDFAAAGVQRIYLELLDLHDLDQVHRAAAALR